MIITYWILLRKRNVSEKFVDEFQEIFYVQQRSPKIVPVWKNVEKYDTGRLAKGNNVKHGECALHAG